MRASWKRRMGAFLVVCAASTALMGVWAFWLEPSSIQVREYSLSLPGWPFSLDGFRIAVLADLHVGSPYNGPDKLREIVELTNQAKPDLILLPGDFIIHGVLGGRFVPPDQIARGLGKLRSTWGTFAVLGNHDHRYPAGNFAETFRSHGVYLLQDASMQIEAGADCLWIVGISDWRRGPHDVERGFSAVPDGAPVILFTHNPDIFPTIAQAFTLGVAGHSHGGQVNLPLLGRPILRSRHGDRFAAGHIIENGRNYFIQTGIGTSILPVRFRVPPEISVLALRSEASAQ